MRDVSWIGSAKADLLEFPTDVISAIGYAIFVAQNGGKHQSAKPLKGYSGASVLEIVENDDGDTYRAVYTVRFAERIYVLHAFQKKSKSGIATPPRDLEKIKTRLKLAEEEHQKWLTRKA